MIYVYTEKPNHEKWIMKNDWYFNLYTSNESISETEKKSLKS